MGFGELGFAHFGLLYLVLVETPVFVFGIVFTDIRQLVGVGKLGFASIELAFQFVLCNFSIWNFDLISLISCNLLTGQFYLPLSAGVLNFVVGLGFTILQLQFPALQFLSTSIDSASEKGDEPTAWLHRGGLYICAGLATDFSVFTGPDQVQRSFYEFSGSLFGLFALEQYLSVRSSANPGGDFLSQTMASIMDNSDSLQQLLVEAGVDEKTRTYITGKGFTTIALLGFAVPENGLEEFVKFLTPVEEPEIYQPFSPQASCLRRAITKCLEAIRCDSAPGSPNMGLRPTAKSWNRPPPLASKPARAWGAPPPLENRPSQVISASEAITSSEAVVIRKDLCFWQNLSTTISIEELAAKVTAAPWFEKLLLKLAEGVAFLTGCPKAGKSSLVVNVAKCLGLTRTRTTSKNFWLFAKNNSTMGPSSIGTG